MKSEILDGSRNLTHQLTHELGRAIVQGRYKIDASFPTEAELSEHFQISRSVTREAVKMLTAKGLISSRPRKGIRVQPAAHWNMFDTDVLQWTATGCPSLELLRDFTELRLAIEPEAVALACVSATMDQLKDIEHGFERIRAAESGQDDLLDAKIEFHIAVLDAGNNRFFSQFHEFIRAAVRLGGACRDQVEAAPAVGSEDYAELYECIRRQGSDEGRATMRRLLTTTLDITKLAIGKRRDTRAAARVLS